MNTSYLSISAEQVFLSLVMIALAIFLSRMNRAQLEKQYLWGAVRSFIQLWLVGYVLYWLFQSKNPYLLSLTVEFMIVIGTITAVRRQKEMSVHTIGILWLVLHATLFVLGGFVFLFVFRIYVFDYPHLFIPLMGMVIGNCANGASLVLHRLRGEIESRRGEIEAALALGATPRQAIEPYMAQTLQNALIPIINSMMLMGIVQLPGIMTGQMLSGIVPQEAVRYQIVVVYLLAGSVAFTCHLTVRMEIKRYFTSRWGLILP